MMRFCVVVLIVVAFLALEVFGLFTLTAEVGWPITLAEVFLTAMLGGLIIFFTPARWKAAVVHWDDDADPAQIDRSVRDAKRNGVLLLLAAILLILPGAITDVVGFLLLAWVAASSLWRHRSSHLEAFGLL
jgi:UPF0716 family protein affecting phage T7 exclusion